MIVTNLTVIIEYELTKHLLFSKQFAAYLIR